MLLRGTLLIIGCRLRHSQRLAEDPSQRRFAPSAVLQQRRAYRGWNVRHIGLGTAVVRLSHFACAANPTSSP